jgi:hypothetical protein
MSQALKRLTTAHLSRRTLFKGIGALGTGLLLSQLGLLKAVLAEDETVADIVNIAATAESMAVTLLGGAIGSARRGTTTGRYPTW